MHVLILNAHGDDVVRNHIGSLSPRRPGARSRGPERRSSTGCRSHHNPSQPIVNGGMVTEATWKRSPNGLRLITALRAAR